MKKIIVIISIYFVFSGVSYAEVSQFVFTNDSRTVAPGALSESLTIQSQNSVGTQESITETTDLVFQSTSPTGEFLNSSGNPVSTTMSKNTANRTFYYKDSASGAYLITVTATGRDTQKVFKVTQNIVVGAGAVNQSGDTNQTSTTSTVTTRTSSNPDISSHSNPSPVSDSRSVVNFEISAGRKRLTSVGSEIVFKAEPVKLLGVPENYIQYTWSFGDGSVANGQVVSHRYKFDGDYVVLLNGVYSDKSAVSRTDVLVIKPLFNVGVISGGVRLTNMSSSEINIGEWVVEGPRSRFEFPRDTIIEKGKTVTFPYQENITDTDRVVLKDPLGVIVAERTPVLIIENSPILEEVKKDEIKNEPIVKIVYRDKPVAKKEVGVATTTEEKKEEIVTGDTKTDSLVANVYSGSQKASAFESFLWIPRKGWGLLSQLFK